MTCKEFTKLAHFNYVRLTCDKANCMQVLQYKVCHMSVLPAEEPELP